MANKPTGPAPITAISVVIIKKNLTQSYKIKYYQFCYLEIF
jgi:hypothetical protein